MSKYDNSAFWESYRDTRLLVFLKEFENHIDFDGRKATEVWKDMEPSTFDDWKEYLKKKGKDRLALEKLTTRFKSYAYKKRRGLSSISISVEVITKLDMIIKKECFADYSDAITHLIKHHDWNRELT